MKSKKLSKKQVRKLWVDTLRSGKYQQGAGYLRNKDDKYCCLGVLCQLAIEHGVIEDQWIMHENDRAYTIGGKACLISEKVKDWVGLKSNSGEFSSKREQGCTLASLNDSGHYSFSDIADFIESKPEGLFV